MSPHKTLALVLLVLHLSACTSWQPTTASPRQFVEEEEPDQIRITQTGGDRVTIHDPAIRADSIVGGGSQNWLGRRSEIGVPFSDIGQFEVRRFSSTRTTVRLGFAVGCAVFFAAVYRALDTGGHPFSGG